MVPGDAMQLAGSHSYFVAEAPDAELQRRLAAHDIHPTGPLAGRGETPVRGACLALENAVLAEFEPLRQGLAAAGLKQDRRALRLPVGDLEWHWPDATTLVLAFSLPAGSYATSVLRELVMEK
jgi:tRNA pseudouridine13 synthase